MALVLVLLVEPLVLLLLLRLLLEPLDAWITVRPDITVPVDWA